MTAKYVYFPQANSINLDVCPLKYASNNIDKVCMVHLQNIFPATVFEADGGLKKIRRDIVIELTPASVKLLLEGKIIHLSKLYYNDK